MNKRVLVVACVFIFLFSIQQLWGQTYQTYVRVFSPVATVYSFPSLKALSLQQATQGTVFPYLEKKTVSRLQWYKITLPSGEMGWIPATLCKIISLRVHEDDVNSTAPPISSPPDPPESSRAQKIIIVKVQSANLLSDISGAGTVISSVKKHSKLIVIQKKNDWYQVNYQGTIGWVHSALVKPVKGRQTATPPPTVKSPYSAPTTEQPNQSTQPPITDWSQKPTAADKMQQGIFMEINLGVSLLSLYGVQKIWMELDLSDESTSPDLGSLDCALQSRPAPQIGFNLGYSVGSFAFGGDVIGITGKYTIGGPDLPTDIDMKYTMYAFGAFGRYTFTQQKIRPYVDLGINYAINQVKWDSDYTDNYDDFTLSHLDFWGAGGFLYRLTDNIFGGAALRSDYFLGLGSKTINKQTIKTGTITEKTSINWMPLALLAKVAFVF